MSAFLSYSRSDTAQAMRFAKRLQGAGVDIWVDQERVEAGTPWDRAVQEGLQRSTAVVVLLSPASVESPNVLDEITYAIENSKKILPILLARCSKPIRLARLQHIDLSVDFDGGVDEVARLIGGGAKVPEPHSMPSPPPPPPIRTTIWPRRVRLAAIAALAALFISGAYFAIEAIDYRRSSGPLATGLPVEVESPAKTKCIDAGRTWENSTATCLPRAKDTTKQSR